MSNSVFYSHQDSSLDAAWAHAYLELIEHPSRELAPFTVSIVAAGGLTVPDSLSHPMVKALDACLEQDDHQNVEKVAFTIFPERLWRICGGDRQELYREFMLSLRTYVKWEPQKNKGGMYFGRLIGFGIDHKTGKDLGYEPTMVLAKDGNQLEHIIRQCKKSAGQRRSVARMQLQATTFDPFRDLTSASRPCFPCLQHIAFDPDIKAGSLSLTAFYATQQLFVKAYGNWLGLCRLGTFVAGQAGLKFTRFTCFVGVQKMDILPNRGELRTNLIQTARDVVSQKVASGQMVPQHAF